MYYIALLALTNMRVRLRQLYGDDQRLVTCRPETGSFEALIAIALGEGYRVKRCLTFWR